MRRRLHFLSFFLGIISGNLAGMVNLSFFTFLLVPFIGFKEHSYLPGISLKLLAIIVAPIFEELAKLVPVFFILSQERGYLVNINQWLALSIVAALGFSIFENITYFIVFTSLYKIDTCLLLMILRYMLATPMHLSSTLVTSYGVGMWYLYNAKIFLIFIPMGIGVHSLYNFVISMVIG